MNRKTYAQEGKDDLVLQSGWNVQVNFDETINGNASFECEEEFALNDPVQIGDNHPKDDRLELIDFNIVGIGSGKCRIDCVYFGITQAPTRPIWSYFNGINEEPIETHPKFSDFAGSKDNPNEGNGAIFGDDGEFFGFASDSEFAGVRSFLAGGITMRKTWYTDKSRNGIENTFKTFNFPSGSIPGLPDGSNVLKTNWGSNPIGNLYQVYEEFTASGEGGWNSTIYDPGTVT